MEFSLSHSAGDHAHADVAGFDEYVPGGEVAVGMHISDGTAVGEGVGAADGPDLVWAGDIPGECGSHDEGFEGGTGLVGVGEAAISAEFRGGVFEVLGVEGWPVAEGEDVAGVGVDDDGLSAFDAVFGAGCGEFLFGDHLDVGVDGEDEMLAVGGGHVVALVDADGAAFGVFFDSSPAAFSG